MSNSNNNIFGLKNLPKNNVGAAVNTGNLLGLNTAPAAVSTELSANLKNLAAPFDVAFFFDNDDKYIQQLSGCAPKIKSHKVAGRKYIDGTPIGSIIYDAYMKPMTSVGKEFGDVIAKLIASQGDRGIPYEESIDIGSGIQAADVAILEIWLEKHAGKKMAVLIDYDRTLTQMEGGYILGNSIEEMKDVVSAWGIPTDPITLDGFVEYYVGGRRRMKMLQAMFDMIYSTPNVSVYILTNNPACHAYKGLFDAVIGVLTKNRPFGTLCSSLTGGNKKTAIQQGGPMLKPLCVVSGGRCGKKTRRHGKKRKTTRRR